MSSFIELYLDTTSPQLSIDIPTRTIPQNVVEIEIKSNEVLAIYQEIYIIDAVGNRYDYIFNKLDDYTYYGLVDFQEYPMGIATLYCRLKDEVFNESELYSKNINIGYIPNRVECFIDTFCRVSNIDVIEREKDIKTIQREKSIDYIERSKQIDIIHRDSNVEVI